MTEQDYQELADITCLILELYKHPQVRIKKRKRGLADLAENIILLPTWLEKQNQYYILAYVIHEVAHFVNWHRNKSDKHDQTYFDIEDEGLAAWGLRKERKRIYTRALFYKGEEVWRLGTNAS